MCVMLVVVLAFSSLISLQTASQDVFSSHVTPQDLENSTDATTDSIQTADNLTTAAPLLPRPPRSTTNTTSLGADEYYNQFCVDDETGRYYRRGESWHLSQDCIKVMCKLDSEFQLKKFYVGCGDIDPVAPCERVEGIRMGIFPECCPMVSCPSSVKQQA